jgi:hypothetical protein
MKKKIEITSFFSDKIAYVTSNYINQITSLLFFFLIANRLSKMDFVLCALIQLTSSVLRYFNFGTPFFVQNKVLKKPKSDFSLILGFKIQFYFILVVVIASVFYFKNGTVTSFQALLMFLYIVSENIYNYFELIVRSKGGFNRLIRIKLISSIITIFFILVILLDYLSLELVLFRYIFLWLLSCLYLSFEFVTIDFFKKVFYRSSVHTNSIFLFIKSSIPYGLIIYSQELFLIFPRFLISFVDSQLIGELAFGLSVVSNFNLAIASLLQMDYNVLYNFFLKKNRVLYKLKLYSFFLKYFSIYITFTIIVIGVVPLIFNFFDIFNNFKQIKITFSIFTAYYFIMTLLTPVHILVNINKSNKILSSFSVYFLLFFSAFFFLLHIWFYNALIALAISFIASLLIYSIIVAIYFRRYYIVNTTNLC